MLDKLSHLPLLLGSFERVYARARKYACTCTRVNMLWFQEARGPLDIRVEIGIRVGLFTLHRLVTYRLIRYRLREVVDS